MNIALRPVEESDQEFLYHLYASTREDEMTITGWTDAEKMSFLRMQFNAQQKGYQTSYREADFDIIMAGDQPIGRFCIDRRPDEIRIMDIALLSPYRNQGIGSMLMKRILDEGRQRGLPVRIHVAQTNPARLLYRRLGFRTIADTGVHFLLEWTPAAENNDLC